MFNVEQYIERCLQSVFDQQVKENVYEIILINDGSPDNSQIVAENFCEGKSNINIIRQGNKGLGGARNTGIYNAKGEYLVFLDSDDWILPNFLRTLSEFINNEDIIEFSVQVKTEIKTLHTIDFEKTSPTTGINYFLENKTINSACNKIYRRTFLQDNKLLFKERIYGEDIEFNSRAFYLAKTIKSIQPQLIVFYQSENSITRSQDHTSKLKYFKDLEKVIISINDFKNSFLVLENNGDKYFKERIGSLSVNSLLFGLKNKISPHLIRSFIKSLKTANCFDISKPMKNRNFFRLLFNNKYAFEIILFLNTLRS